MYLGELIEFDETAKIFTNPSEEGDRRLHHGPLRLTGEPPGSRALPLVLLILVLSSHRAPRASQRSTRQAPM